jgi:tetratricopeptide (TPR) repeat protein
VRRDRQDEHEPATLLGPPDTDGVLLNLAGNLAQPSRTLRLAADALLQAWPEAELPGWPAAGLRSCTAALRQSTGNRLWAGSLHPVLLRAGDSLDHARLTGPAVDHWHDLVITSCQLLGAGHPDTILAGQRLAEACLAAGHVDQAVSWFQWLLDGQAEKLGPDHHDVIAARLRLGHALVAARQSDRAIAALERVISDSERVRGFGQAEDLGARDELAAAYLAAGRHSDAITLCTATCSLTGCAPRDPATRRP